jgi:hypothetical protein
MDWFSLSYRQVLNHHINGKILADDLSRRKYDQYYHPK